MSSVFIGCFDSVAEVLVPDVLAEDVPYAGRHLSCNGYLYFHLVLSVEGKHKDSEGMDRSGAHHYLQVTA